MTILFFGAKFAVAIERGDADAVGELLKEAPADTWIEYGEHKTEECVPTRVEWLLVAADERTLRHASGRRNLVQPREVALDRKPVA